MKVSSKTSVILTRTAGQMWTELIACVLTHCPVRNIKLQIAIAAHYDFCDSCDFLMKDLTIKTFALLLIILSNAQMDSHINLVNIYCYSM